MAIAELRSGADAYLNHQYRLAEGCRDRTRSSRNADLPKLQSWDNGGAQGLKFAFEAVKAYAKGEIPKTDEKQHGKVDL